MPLHRDYVPTADAIVVRRLRGAGAILLGKLQLTKGAFAEIESLVGASKLDTPSEWRLATIQRCSER